MNNLILSQFKTLNHLWRTTYWKFTEYHVNTLFATIQLQMEELDDTPDYLSKQWVETIEHLPLRFVHIMSWNYWIPTPEICLYAELNLLTPTTEISLYTELNLLNTYPWDFSIYWVESIEYLPLRFVCILSWIYWIPTPEISLYTELNLLTPTTEISLYTELNLLNTYHWDFSIYWVESIEYLPLRFLYILSWNYWTPTPEIYLYNELKLLNTYPWDLTI